MFSYSELRKPKYLSPSSLHLIEKNPNKFYSERMRPDRNKPEPQSMPAAVGSAFDAFIKIHIMNNHLHNEKTIRERLFKGMYTEEDREKYKEFNTAQILFDTNVESHNRVEASTAGSWIFSEYVKTSFDTLEFIDIERNDVFYLMADDVSIPIRCKADAVIFDYLNEDGKKAPLDWKVSGYGSETGQSPKPRYCQSWSNQKALGPHSLYEVDIPIEQIDINWATQLTTYGWAIGYALGTEFPVYIDQFAIRKEKIKLARFRAIATPQWQAEVISRYKNAWISLKDGSFINRVACTNLFSEMLAADNNWWR